MVDSAKYLKIFLWAMPFLTAALIFRSFLSGPPHFQVDSGVCFISNHYFLQNLARGVFSFWNPFNAWGRPEDFILQMNGVYNPFLLLPLALQFLGLSFIAAYKVYIVAYFAFGLWGFTLLARRLFKQEWQAYLAFLLLLFSNLWINLFNDALTILIFIPSVWFFYFAVSFLQEFRPRDYLGMVFALMMILTTYLPFFFILVALFVLFFFVLLYFKELSGLIGGIGIFVKKYPKWFFLGMALVILYAVPGFLWMHFSHDYAVSWRGSPDADPLKLSFAAIDNNPAVVQNGLVDCLTGQDTCVVNFYMPIYGFLLAGLAVLVAIGKRTLFFAGVASCLIMTILGSASPLYGLLSKAFFFMKYFRNIHFLIWFAVPFIILCICDLAERFFSALPTWPRFLTAGFLVAGHALAAGFLVFLGGASLSAWVMISLSLTFCLAVLITGYHPRSWLFMAGLFVLVVVQPLGVFRNMTSDWERSVFPNNAERYQKLATPSFSYVRPYRGETTEKWSEAPGFGETWDMSGYPLENFQGMKWTYLFQNKLPYDEVKEYVRHKLILYDRVEALPEGDGALAVVGAAIHGQKNTAYVADPSGKLPPLTGGGSGRPQMVTRDTSEFRVVSFDLNGIRIKTNFKGGQFLVYNDSYHPFWQAWVNGKRVELYRANFAFKGLYLPAGENDIVFSFPGPWLAWLFPGMILLSLGMFAYIAFLSWCLQRELMTGRAG
jgi:hypothetical protein